MIIRYFYQGNTIKYILIAFFSLSLFASSEFRYIEPVSVEINPNFIDKPQLVEIVSEKNESIETSIVDVIEEPENTQEIFEESIFEESMVEKNSYPQMPNIKFASKKYDVTTELIDSLKEFAGFLLQNKNYQVIIYGYTDSIGEAQDNKLLSQRRANSVKEGFITLGVSSTKLTAIGRGEKNPIADNINREGREKNRRIEIELIK